MAPLSPLPTRTGKSFSQGFAASLTHILHPRSPASPAHSATKPVDPNYTPGSGTFDPRHIDNRGIFALFALIGASLVLTAIWFFFWAKNGGFHFRKGDWEDYKSTVLRRKGPNGTTLSGATKTTALGGGSIVAEGALDVDEKGWKKAIQKGGNKIGRKPRGNKNNEDEDVRAYRHEKPARVGGLNRDSDAVASHDFATTTYSDSVGVPETGFHVPINTPRTKKTTSHTPSTPSSNRNRRHSGFYATPASNASTDSHRPLRPNPGYPGYAGSGSSTPTRSRNSSPRKSSTVPGAYDAASLDYDSRYSHSEAGFSEDARGNKSYVHHIPGLGSDLGSRAGRAGMTGMGAGGAGGGGGGGFRRGRGRRDSLSDSEGETVLS